MINGGSYLLLEYVSSWLNLISFSSGGRRGTPLLEEGPQGFMNCLSTRKVFTGASTQIQESLLVAPL